MALTMRKAAIYHHGLIQLIMICSLFNTVLGLSSQSRKVAVIGGTGRLGREAVCKLSSAGIPVKCLIRSEPPPAFLSSLTNVEFIKGDVTDIGSLKLLLEDCTDCLALYGATRRSKISDLWSDAEAKPGHSKLVNFDGVKNIIEACEKAKTCKRIVRITGKGETPWSFFSVLINFLGSMAKGWNYEGEELLRRQSSIDYTIIRPGMMKDMEEVADTGVDARVLALKDNGGDLKVSAVPYGTIADLCVECLDYPNAARATLTAMNVPAGEGAETYSTLLANVTPDSRKFPTNLIKEHKRAVRTFVATFVAVLAAVSIGTIRGIWSLF